MRARLPQSGDGERGPGMAQRGGLLLPGEPRPRRAGRRRISAGTLPRQSRRARRDAPALRGRAAEGGDRKSTRLNSSHTVISYAVFCLKKKKKKKKSE